MKSALAKARNVVGAGGIPGQMSQVRVDQDRGIFYYRKTDWTIEELVCEDNATYTPFENALLEFDGEAESE